MCIEIFLQLNTGKIKLFLLVYQPAIVPFMRKGKSGQQRATHRLSAGFILLVFVPVKNERESATENNCRLLA